MTPMTKCPKCGEDYPDFGDGDDMPVIPGDAWEPPTPPSHTSPGYLCFACWANTRLADLPALRADMAERMAPVEDAA